MNVSVVIPALNEEEVIERTLDRIGTQLDAGDEVIIMDGGSEDGTVGIAKSFAFTRVNVHSVASVAAQRQAGAEQASNPLVATTDADTIPAEDWLARIRAHFNNDRDLAVVWGAAEDMNGTPVRDIMGKFLPMMGGASGCNTAFRRSVFERLDLGYLDTPYPVFNGFEDWTLVQRLSRVGKSVHDPDLVVRTDFPRFKYQTIPLVAAGGLATALGLALPNPVGRALLSGGVSMAATELSYEQFSGSSVHHDQVGLGVAALSPLLGPAAGPVAAGVGAGLVGHHAATEGVSAFPTRLLDHTDRVVQLDTEQGERVRLSVDSSQGDVRLTQGLIIGAAGTLAGGGATKLLQWWKGRSR